MDYLKEVLWILSDEERKQTGNIIRNIRRKSFRRVLPQDPLQTPPKPNAKKLRLTSAAQVEETSTETTSTAHAFPVPTVPAPVPGSLSSANVTFTIPIAPSLGSSDPNDVLAFDVEMVTPNVKLPGNKGTGVTDVSTGALFIQNLF